MIRKQGNNNMPPKPSTSPRTKSGRIWAWPARGTWREAGGLFIFSAMFAILFDLFYTYGIELRIPPVKTAGLQDRLKPSPATPPSTYTGWSTPKGTHISPKTVTPASPSPADPFQRLSLIGAKDRYDKGTCVFLDARKPEEYSEGHIPGAKNFFGNELEKYAPLVVPQLQAKDQEIIAYCHGGDCDLSLQVAKALRDAGYTRVEIFEGGWPDWKKAGYPVKAGDLP
jgi:rhodanese-related sulfurtransferase